MRYLITFAYDGTLFNGYQIQKQGRTVQKELEMVLTKINNNKVIKVIATGRTDAKVHALNQKAHFDMEINISPDKFKRAINRLLPKDIYIKQLEVVNEDFHARFKVKEKEYKYIINTGEYNPIERNYIYQYNKKLNLEEIKKAFKYLEGEHDFKSFSKTDKEKENYVRILSKITLIIEEDKVIIYFKGNGFFRYMIRNIVGTLIEIGEGKRNSKEIVTILNSNDRRKAGKTAKPEGLYLVEVIY